MSLSKKQGIRQKYGLDRSVFEQYCSPQNSNERITLCFLKIFRAPYAKVTIVITSIPEAVDTIVSLESPSGISPLAVIPL